MEHGEKVTADDIISEVSNMLDDVDMAKGISYGAYMNGVQRSLESLSINLFMNTRTFDILVPQNTLTIPMEEDVFNIKEFYLHNGVCCQPGNDMAIVHFKRQYNNSQGGAGYSAKIKESQPYDVFYNPDYTNDIQFDDNGIFYANVENGLIMFGEKCRRYKYFRIVANTMGGKIGEKVMIPRIVREAITYMTAKQVCFKLMVRDRSKYGPIYQMIVQELEAPYTGLIDKAKISLVRMGTWKRNDWLQRNGTAKY